ncbi:MAG: DnaJ domain-containing protein [Spirochaetales bacterium]|nr:DnaJ domain-containing protein [Spirochaetales bacterium]
MPNYYEVLGVEKTASFKKIRYNFRKKAKMLHPDVSNKTKQDAEEDMRLLLIAYRVLSNSQKRRNYDHELKTRTSKVDFNYRDYLRSKPADLALQSKLIFYDILNGNAQEALALYETLMDRRGYRLERYLDYGDFMDCAFLLAEEFDRQKQYVKAFLLFKKLFSYELEKPYFHHFSEEIIDRLRSLITNKLQHITSSKVFLELLESLLTLNFPDRDKAVFCKKIAEIHSRLGNRSQAREYLRKGLHYDKKLPGTKKLSLKIGLAEIKP